MKRRVAFENVFGSPVVIVEVARAELGSQAQEQSLRQKYAQVTQFQGVLVALGVQHEGPLEADFSAPQDIRMALKKIGWIRLHWQDAELPD
jgi:hypothetical protein